MREQPSKKKDGLSVFEKRMTRTTKQQLTLMPHSLVVSHWRTTKRPMVVETGLCQVRKRTLNRLSGISQQLAGNLTW
jgi:hypothetical protein